MIVRQCMRTFKSWLQYRAETLGIPEESLRASMEKLKTGDFDNWKIENDVRIRLNFILDHCNPEEQAFYLKEFTTPQLARFLVKEIRFLSVPDLEKLLNVQRRGHVLPVVNALFNIRTWLKTVSINSNENLDDEQKLRKVVKLYLEEKLKEFEWRAIDEKMENA